MAEPEQINCFDSKPPSSLNNVTVTVLTINLQLVYETCPHYLTHTSTCLFDKFLSSFISFSMLCFCFSKNKFPSYVTQLIDKYFYKIFIYYILYTINTILNTNYHTTNKCTNCMSFIFKSLFKTLSLLLHVSIAYRLSSSGSTYNS